MSFRLRRLVHVRNASARSLTSCLSENRSERHGFGTHSVMSAGEAPNIEVRIGQHPGEKYRKRWEAIGRSVDSVLFTELPCGMMANADARECRARYEGRLFYLLVPRFSFEKDHIALKNAGLLDGRTDQICIGSNSVVVLDLDGRPYVKNVSRPFRERRAVKARLECHTV